ncbi:MAG: hypothetical protein LBT20_06830 [Clostridiales bacterium]|jgi:hypothetical protein|nr:hypothetical protein [Clostridiales bacterium]
MAKHKYQNKRANDAEPITKESAAVSVEPILSAAEGGESTEFSAATDTGSRLRYDESGRIPIIDNARGIMLILLMVFGLGLASGYLPAFWNSHSLTPGLLFCDLFTPAILFTLGLTLELSFKKRAKTHGKKSARAHLLKRGAAFVAFEVIVNEIYLLASGNYTAALGFPTWGLYSSLGMGMIAAALFLHLKPKYRLIAIGALAVIPYLAEMIFPELIRYLYAGVTVIVPSWGRLDSFFSFGAIILAYSMLTELIFKNFKRYVKVYLIIFALAVLCVLMTYVIQPFVSPAEGTSASEVPAYVAQYLKNPFVINLPTFSIGYIIVAVAFGGACIFIMYGLHNVTQKDIPFIASLGKNTFLVYVFFSIMLNINFRIQQYYSSEGLNSLSKSLTVSIAIMVASTAFICLLTWFLDKRKWYVRL